VELAECLAKGRRLANTADHAWPSGHAAYMPVPCGEILGDWLYPLAESFIALDREYRQVAVAIEVGGAELVRRIQRMREILKSLMDEVGPPKEWTDAWCDCLEALDISDFPLNPV